MPNVTDLEVKKAFLYEGALLYDKMISLAPYDALKTRDVLQRYLAFRVVMNAMAFEELINNRQNGRFRKIRDVLLAHKQEPKFFDGYRSAEEIRDTTIKPLLVFMDSYISHGSVSRGMPELEDPFTSRSFRTLVSNTLRHYQEDTIASPVGITNNFLLYDPNHVYEVSNNDLAGCFFRYHSSRALVDLARCLVNELNRRSIFDRSLQHIKLDLVLHGINMADCVFKHTRNTHSIDGLYEIMKNQNIGDPGPLATLMADSNYQTDCKAIRNLRNKLVGHMDKDETFTNLQHTLSALPLQRIYHFVRHIDYAVCIAAQSDTAIRSRYQLANQPIPDAISVRDLGTVRYF